MRISSCRAEKVSVSISPTPGAVERVGSLGPERLDVEVVRSAPYLLVDRERDAEGRMRPARPP